MIRIAGIALILMAVACSLHAENLKEVTEDITTDLMRELLLEKSYKTGLNTRGISGFFLTSSAESIFEKGFFAGSAAASASSRLATGVTQPAVKRLRLRRGA